MDITDDMRRAVYRADCKYQGHQPDFRTAFGESDRPNPNDSHGYPLPVVRGPVEGQLPHIKCRHCGDVWLVIDEPGADYDDAVAKVAARLAPLEPANTTPLEPLPVEGVGGLPIPLAPGVDFDALPPTHPALLYAAQTSDSHLQSSHTEIVEEPRSAGADEQPAEAS